MEKSRFRDVLIMVVTVVSGILVATLLLLMVVYKAKNPIITVDVVVLRDLRVVNNTPTRVAVGLNLSLKNPNKVAFKYTNSTAVLIYWGAVTGEAVVAETFIEAGEISAGKTKAMNVTLTISANGFLGNSEQIHLDSDLLITNLLFHTSISISGTLRTILRMFDYDVCFTSFCDFHINVSNRTIGEQKCTYIEQKWPV